VVFVVTVSKITPEIIDHSSSRNHFIDHDGVRHALSDPGADLEKFKLCLSRLDDGTPVKATTNDRLIVEIVTMKTAVLFSLFAGAAAFAPVSQKTSSSSTTSLESWKASSPYKNEVGAQAPVRPASAFLFVFPIWFVEFLSPIPTIVDCYFCFPNDSWDSSTPWVYWRMPPKSDSTACDMLK
jgi:hypothetical protein